MKDLLNSDTGLLDEILKALPIQLFIHDSQHNLVFTNCLELKTNNCQQCHLYDKAQCGKSERVVKTDNLIIPPSNSTQTNQTGELSLAFEQCALGIHNADYYTKQLTSAQSGEQYTATILIDKTRQKQQEQAYLKANQRAQETLQAQEQFLANMSHELRTPIAGMTGLLEMLMLKTQDQEARLLLKNISSSTQHLNMLVNDILDFSKLDANQLELDLTDYQVMLEMGELLRVHSAAATEKQLNFVLNWHPTSIKTIRLDPLRFNQVMNNILSNAVKFTQQGAIKVDVQVTDQALNIRVQDTGEGMTDEQQQHVFEPFVQADSSIGRKYGGTGLGLTIVHNLINLMKGTIEIQSQKGLGTLVSITIPHTVTEYFSNSFENLSLTYNGQHSAIHDWLSAWKCKNQRDATKQVAIVDQGEIGIQADAAHIIKINPKMAEFKRHDNNQTEISSSPLFPDLLFETLQTLDEGYVALDGAKLTPLSGHILVAEDNPINQLMLSKQLESIGLSAQLVADGEAAFKLLKAKPADYCLLLTDCHMPVMNGFELAKRVRAEIPEFSTKPIIACTAEDSRVGVEEGRLCDFDSVLYKPYGLQKIHHLLSSYLNKDLTVLDVNSTANNSDWINTVVTEYGLSVLHAFKSSMQQDKERLLALPQPMEIKDIAHRIKGGAGMVSAECIRQLAMQLEKRAMQSPNGLDLIVQDLVALMDIELEEVEKYLNEAD